MKIVFLDSDTLGNIQIKEKFEAYGEVILYSKTNINETVERIKDADFVFTNKVVLNKEILSKTNTVKYIGVLATGTNNVDLEYAKSKNIVVKNVKGYSTKSVGQHTFALILSLVHQIQRHDTYCKELYSQSSIFTNLETPYFDLEGKTLGIIGLGEIGKEVARIALAFGMKIVYFSTSGQNVNKEFERLQLDELLNQSDIVSIHAPLNDRTENLISIQELEMMKSSSFLINTGRGGIINEIDLANALDRDLIAGAALDVFKSEPINLNNPLLQCKKNLILTPHIAWASIESREKLIELAFQNLENFLKTNS